MVIVNENIISQLAKDEACKPSLLALRRMSIKEMLQHYVDKIDFSICSDLLNADFMLKYSTKQERNSVGIHVNEVFAKGNPSMFIMIGKCDIGMIANGYNVGQVFIRDNSICNLNTYDNASTMIDCFCESKITISQKDNAKIFVNVYGNSSVEILHAEKPENIKINIKHKDKY